MTFLVVFGRSADLCRADDMICQRSGYDMPQIRQRIHVSMHTLAVESVISGEGKPLEGGVIVRYVLYSIFGNLCTWRNVSRRKVDVRIQG